MAQKSLIVVALLIFGGFLLLKKSKDEVRPKATVIKRRQPQRPVQNTVTAIQPEQTQNTEVQTSETIQEEPVQNTNAEKPPESQVPVRAAEATPEASVQPTPEPIDPKVEMEQTRKEVENHISDAKSAISLKCRCSVDFEVMWGSFESALALKKAGYIVENFKQAMPGYCADDGAVMACKIKSVRISYANDPDIQWNSGIGTLTTNGVVIKTFDELIALVENQ